MNNNTRPEQRADVNGKIVTRHVKTGEATKAPIVVPAPNLSPDAATSYGQSLLKDAATTDLSGVDAEGVKQIVSEATAAINKDTMWDAFKLFTKGLETTDDPEAMADSMNESGTVVKLRDTWLDANSANLADRSYVEIDGEGGYSDYNESFTSLSDALRARFPETSVEEGKIEVEAYTPSIEPVTYIPEAPDTTDDAYGDALIAAGASTDFASMDATQIKDAVTAVSNRINEDNLWKAFDVLTRSIEGNSHPESFLSSMVENNVTVRLRDTWLSMHGADLADRAAYSKIEGENGYLRYMDTFAKLSRIMKERVPNQDELYPPRKPQEKKKKNKKKG